MNSFSGTKQSYGEPQVLTDVIREALRDKKPLPEKIDEKSDTNHEPDADKIKKSNKI